jgi:glycosyltransferase involved in cell wall biosynthesis
LKRKPTPPFRSLAIVTAFYPPAVGGSERYSQGFARAAVDLGLTVNVITTAPIRKPDVVVEDNGINVLRIPALHVPIQGSYFPIPIQGTRLVAEFLHCDVVIAQTRFFLTSLAAAILARSWGGRICVVEHGSGPLRSVSLFTLATSAYERAITAALKCFSPKFFAVSDASADWLRHFGINDARVLPNGIAPRATRPLRDVSAFAKPIVLYAGRLFPEKGVIELVDAVEELALSGQPIELRVAGRGPLSSLLRSRAVKSEVLTYLGSITPGEVAAELDRATVLANPSNCYEGLPTVLLEAGAAALPVISTRRGGSSEVIRDGSTGWLLDEGTVECIASCLADVVSQPKEANRRGAELFKLVQERYTWPSIVRQFLGDLESEVSV